MADYLDLYLLDVLGADRRARHFYIEKDHCCFPGAASHAFSARMTELARKITGNSLEFVIDTSTERHELGLATLDGILADFTGQKPARTATH